MSLKVHQANSGVLEHASELLRAHQRVIDGWYDTWTREQRSKAIELLRKRHRDLLENRSDAD
jgi:hypothetical protein